MGTYRIAINLLGEYSVQRRNWFLFIPYWDQASFQFHLTEKAARDEMRMIVKGENDTERRHVWNPVRR